MLWSYLSRMRSYAKLLYLVIFLIFNFTRQLVELFCDIQFDGMCLVTYHLEQWFGIRLTQRCQYLYNRIYAKDSTKPY